MLESEVVTFLQSGCALVACAASGHGTPIAARAWGLDIDPERRSARVLLRSDDPVLHEHLVPSAKIAVLGTSTVELRVVHIKGPIEQVARATDDDRERSRRYRDAVFGMLVDVEGRNRSLLERVVPLDLTACVFSVDEVIDLTPLPAVERLAELAW